MKGRNKKKRVWAETIKGKRNKKSCNWWRKNRKRDLVFRIFADKCNDKRKEETNGLETEEPGKEIC